MRPVFIPDAFHVLGVNLNVSNKKTAIYLNSEWDVKCT